MSWVMDIHSHGIHDAGFSPTDDADEIATGLYGVMGNLDTPKPRFVLRYSCGGSYREVDPRQVFEEVAG
ncbi:MAG: hypothetical protein ACYC2T_05030 [Bacillota bacterium]